MNSLLSPLPLFPSLTLKPLNPKPSNPRTLTTLKPLTLAAKPSPKTLTPTLAAKTPTPSLSSAAATAIAAAALLLSSLLRPSPSLAQIPKPETQTETISETLTESDIETERKLEEFLAENPDDIPSLRSLMELKVKSKNLVEAIAVVDRLIALEPEETDLPLLKAHLYGYSGNPAVAKQQYEELLEKNPFLVEAYHGLVMTATNADDDAEMERILKRVEETVEVCRKEGKKSELRDFLLLLGQIRVIEGNYDDSIRIYEELVKEEPRDFRPYLCQGIVYTLLKKKDEAEKQFRKYRKLVPKGHPYAEYLEEDVMALKAMGQMDLR